jgi:lipid A ethanolaminephosphotransferase
VYIDKYYQKADIKARYPESDENYDGILLDGLYEDIMASDKNKVLVVIHTSTSHGPTYFEKYPSEFEVFSPVCTTVEMSKADHDELMNAYDNTIVYTDYLIHSVIEILGQISDRRSCMLYVSDHGESLGENNLYMHGVPMMMAPKEQIEIPFIVWNSDAEQKIKDLDLVGHYHVFHSVLHFLDVASPVYDEEMNIFSHEK